MMVVWCDHQADVHSAGQIGYALAPQVARGAALGPDQPVILHLLDIPPAAQSLEGVRMELIDSAYPLLQGKRQQGLCPDFGVVKETLMSGFLQPIAVWW